MTHTILHDLQPAGKAVPLEDLFYIEFRININWNYLKYEFTK